MDKNNVRLIDANALLKRIAHHTVHDSLKRITFEAANTYEQVKEDMFNLVQKAPVVDAVPMVHGRWLPGVPITCSLCGKPAAEYGTTTEFWLSPYCPWCGQPMDAKEVEADGV